MIWALAMAAGVVAGLLTGGSIENFARLRFRVPLLVLGAVALRFIVLLTPVGRIEGAEYLYVLTLAAIVAWTVLHFDRLPGIWLVAAGGVLNLTVILANTGRMPVAPELAGALVQRGHIGQYTLMGPNTQLNFLGDWISVFPFPEAYSAGDLVIAVGIAVVAFLAVHPMKGGNTAPYSELTPP
jgi:hypothetical protein